MNSLLVLGEIPGTDIQITFTVWLIVLAVILGAVIIRLYVRGKHFSALRLLGRSARLTSTPSHQPAE